MTDSEIKRFIEYFGESLPNPEHSPKQFMFYVKMFKHYKEIGII